MSYLLKKKLSAKTFCSIALCVLAVLWSFASMASNKKSTWIDLQLSGEVKRSSAPRLFKQFLLRRGFRFSAPKKTSPKDQLHIRIHWQSLSRVTFSNKTFSTTYTLSSSLEDAWLRSQTMVNFFEKFLEEAIQKSRGRKRKVWQRVRYRLRPSAKNKPVKSIPERPKRKPYKRKIKRVRQSTKSKIRPKPKTRRRIPPKRRTIRKRPTPIKPKKSQNKSKKVAKRRGSTTVIAPKEVTGRLTPVPIIPSMGKESVIPIGGGSSIDESITIFRERASNLQTSQKVAALPIRGGGLKKSLLPEPGDEMRPWGFGFEVDGLMTIPTQEGMPLGAGLGIFGGYKRLHIDVFQQFEILTGVEKVDLMRFQTSLLIGSLLWRPTQSFKINASLGPAFEVHRIQGQSRTCSNQTVPNTTVTNGPCWSARFVGVFEGSAFWRWSEHFSGSLRLAFLLSPSGGALGHALPDGKKEIYYNLKRWRFSVRLGFQWGWLW